MLLLLLSTGCDLSSGVGVRPPAPGQEAGPASGGGSRPNPEGLLVVRAPEHSAHATSFVPQNLEEAAGGAVFPGELQRALQRYEALYGRPPETLFERVVAAADYVANMAKHPYRHKVGGPLLPGGNVPASDPRAWSYAAYPEQLVALAQENQAWTGRAWEAAPGRTMDDVPPIECSFQHLILGGLVNVLGAQWMLVSIAGHDAFTYYDTELGKWVYVESTYNEHYRLRSADARQYEPLSPEELHRLSLAGREDELVPVRHPYQPQRFPSYHPGRTVPYVRHHPGGFQAMAVHLDGTAVGHRQAAAAQVRVLREGTGAEVFAAVMQQGWQLAEPDEDVWAPQGETFLDGLSAEDSRFANDALYVSEISTNLAVAHPTFEQSTDGHTWTRRERVEAFILCPGDTLRFRARWRDYVSGAVVLTRRAERQSSRLGPDAARPTGCM